MESEKLSIHIESNGKKDKCRDKSGKPLEGSVITADNFVHRFRDGLLDGTITTDEGLTIVQPAVEGPGHLEYWKEGKIHRDDGLPAVISEGLKRREWWVNGELEKIEPQEVEE
jgi:hypothetical protein